MYLSLLGPDRMLLLSCLTTNQAFAVSNSATVSISSSFESKDWVIVVIVIRQSLGSFASPFLVVSSLS